MVVHSKWSFKRSGRLHKFDCIYIYIYIPYSSDYKRTVRIEVGRAY